VAKAKQAPGKLDAPTYAKLAERSRLNPIVQYSAVEPKLFDAIIDKYTGGHQAHGQVPTAPARR
jgi:cytochrome o ubiquinol oxidase subunit 2